MTDDAKRPDIEPEIDEPVFTPDEPALEQAQLDDSPGVEPELAARSQPDPPDDARSVDGESEFGEPVFTADDPVPAQSEPEFSTISEPDPPADSAPDPPTEPEPAFASQADSSQNADFRPVPDDDELVFNTDMKQPDPPAADQFQESPEASAELPSTELPVYESASDEEPEFDSVLEKADEHVDEAQQDTPASTGWVNIAPDSEMTVDPLPEKEYTLFEETPVADVAMNPPPRRKLGRTGPVWALGVVLVVIVGLGWLAISRLTGTPDDAAQTAAEPTVQQAEAATPTPPPTATPGPQPTPTRVKLPILSNVIVGDTDGEGVMLRPDPKISGEWVAILEEGDKLVVLEPGPEDEEYPVEADGYLWYRMRVSDKFDDNDNPLIGWSASDFFIVDEQ